MLFSLSWLKQHLETTATVEEIAAKLVTLGVEVEGVEDESSKFKNVVVGHILKREQHPDADKLGVCTVDVGAKEPLQIVCGAPNARDDLRVAVALMGAKLPNGMEIGKAKMRGVESCGMICSAKELGLGEDHSGIMELETTSALGTPFADTLEDLDVIFDVSITPNRGDVLSIYGIARDLAASGLGTLKALPQVTEGKGVPNIKQSIKTDKSSFFSGIEIKGIKNTESPSWLKAKLEQVGLRPRNAVVDVTNYILMDLGQPLHSYDADKVKGSITVSEAKGGEAYKGIGDTECTLNAGDVVICDESGIIGLAGILGGESTAASLETTTVYLEAALFDKSAITQTGQALQVNSDSRYRFERGVDPLMTEYAAKRAAMLIQELCGGEISAMDKSGTTEVTLPEISLNPAKVKTFGGLDIPAEEVKEVLESLGFSVSGSDTFKVTPPSFRTYMETEEDLIEEVLRLKGYDSVPIVLPPLSENTVTTVPDIRGLEWTARYFLSSLGYLETINYSFISEAYAKAFSCGETLVKLANPIDEATMSTMRPSLLAGLLDATAKNMARSVSNIRFGEVGRVFTAKSEQTHAAVIKAGAEGKHWQGKTSHDELFDIKADLYAMIEAMGLSADTFQIYQGAADYYHPGRSGSLKLGKDVVAYFGEVHPMQLKNFGIKGKAYAFELNLNALEKLKRKAKPFVSSNYQAVSKDMAFVVDAAVKAGEMLNTIQKADKDLVTGVELFDVYMGENLPKGKKSFAFNVTMQALDRTLKDEEIKKVMDTIASLAIKHHKAELRDS